MDNLAALAQGFVQALTLVNLLAALLGCVLGTAVGVLPGLGPAVTVAMLLPLTAQISDPSTSLIFFCGIYYGAMYGGSTTSILLNTPGESGTMMTALEGFRMARHGRAGPALATAAIGSFVAGTIATLLLALCAPVVADYAVFLAAPEFFMLMVIAFIAVGGILGKSRLRGVTAVLLGLALGLVGQDRIDGTSRLTLEIPDLIDGIEAVLAAVGLFAVGECLYYAAYEARAKPEYLNMGSVHMSKQDWRRSLPAWLRGTLIGFPFGTIPAGGTEIPTFLSYGIERKLCRYPQEFGKTGAIEGVAGPEAANNAAVTGTLVPLLTLGIPTSVTTAVLLSAFQGYNLNPGPQLFLTSADMVWTLIASLFIGNVMLLLLNLPLIQIWVKLLHIPRAHLFAGILIFATVGVFGMRQSSFDLLLMLAFGLIGLVMRRYDFPVGPVIIGLILGPLAEANMRLAVQMGAGQWRVFVDRPVSLLLLLLAIGLLLWPMLRSLAQRQR